MLAKKGITAHATPRADVTKSKTCPPKILLPEENTTETWQPVREYTKECRSITTTLFDIIALSQFQCKIGFLLDLDLYTTFSHGQHK